MGFFYSQNSGGFYSADIHGSAIPTDAVAISGEEHAALMEAQSQGRVIRADAEGRPVAVEHVPSAEDLATRKQAQAQAALTASDITINRCYEAGVAVPQAWRDYRAALRVIVADPAAGGELPQRPAYPAGT